MANESMLEERLAALKGKIPPRFRQILSIFFNGYRQAIAGFPVDAAVLFLYLDLVEEQFKRPYVFSSYHRKVRHPVDYYKFTLDFIRPLVDLGCSSVLGEEVLDQVEEGVKRGENAVFLANHQTETDPQAIATMLVQKHPKIADEMIYVAGERVVTDPLAVPFSIGTNLLCIYSKRYIDRPPELKAKKQLHNKNTMELMSRLLKEGGKMIYVAPSGGRDRRGSDGEVAVAPFDPGSVEMFYLMARKAKTTTKFYPLSLATYDLLPPPETIQTELGEKRIAKRCGIHLAFAPAFDMESFPPSDISDKIERRAKRAQAIWEIVKKNYELIRPKK